MFTKEEAFELLQIMPGRTIWLPRVYKEYYDDSVEVGGLTYTRKYSTLKAIARKKVVDRVSITRFVGKTLLNVQFATETSSGLPRIYDVANLLYFFTEEEALERAEDIKRLTNEEYFG